jgi:hypothetical protein
MGDTVLYSGSGSAPTAGTVIVQSGTLQRGRYQASVVTYLNGGSPTLATDGNNMALYSGGTEIGPVAVMPVVNSMASNPAAQFTLGSAATISVQAIGSATSGVTYVSVLSVLALENW